MHAANSSQLTARTTDPAWLRELSQIESSYGRLVYLAGLVDPNTGKYRHHSADGEGATTSDTLRRWHEGLFREWVEYSLKRKMADLQEYIRSLNVDHTRLLDAWLRLTPYKNLVPAAICGPERQKHISDFEAILGLLRNVYGVALPD